LFAPTQAPLLNFVIFAPPFAEEMNKSRRMMALMGRRLARRGFATLLPDLTGTGDSDGEFQDGAYEVWRADLEACKNWIEARGGGIQAVIGLRFGALLAMDIASRLINQPPVALWNPVMDGEGLIRQFLRLRIASQLNSALHGRESVASLLDSLATGNSIEVAGYTLSPPLVQSLINLRFGPYPAATGQRILCLHVSRATTAGLGPITDRAMAELSAGGAEVTTGVIVGDAFWSSTEISVCESLLEQTESFIAGSHAV
jgi:exosortase A-associated hydrolase 2